MKTQLSFVTCLALTLLASTTSQAGQVLDNVKSSGTLACGVVTELNDETLDDTHGNLSALGADMCRAVAAAITDGKGHAKILAYPTEAIAYQALQKGEIALMEGGSPNPGLARRYGVTYLTPVFFDGQGFSGPQEQWHHIHEGFGQQTSLFHRPDRCRHARAGGGKPDRR